MSFFFIYDAVNEEYLVQPGGYLLFVVILAALLLCIAFFGNRSRGTHPAMAAKKLVFCSAAMALAVVTSLIRLASLPFGGSITLFSMLFIVLIGYFYGAQTGILTGVAYGILQLITGPYIYTPVQVLLDYPLAFGALGLSGLFHNVRHGLPIGYIVGVAGRYFFHVVSGYVFFGMYTPEGISPLVYAIVYNLTYILPEMILTLLVINIPALSQSIAHVKNMANS